MSNSSAPNADGYVHARTEEEYKRLRTQARMWAPVTRRVLVAAGIAPGMRCLDVGSGPGEGMRVLGELTGAGGSVTGLDVDGAMGRRALAELTATGISDFQFLEGNVETSASIPGGPYDVTMTRITLLHLNDPGGALRKMAAATGPGGILVAQDCDFASLAIEPELPLMQEFYRVFHGVFNANKRPLRMGRSLPGLFRSASLGEPAGVDAAVNFAPLALAAPQLLGVFNGLLPAAFALGLTDEARSARFREEMVEAARSGAYALSPTLISAWKRL